MEPTTIPLILLIALLCWRAGRSRGRAETKTKIFNALHKQDPFFSLGKLNEYLGAWEDFKESKGRRDPNWLQKIVNNFRK